MKTKFCLKKSHISPQTDEYETEVSSPNSESGALTELAPMIPPRSEPCLELPRRKGSINSQGNWNNDVYNWVNNEIMLIMNLSQVMEGPDPE